MSKPEVIIKNTVNDLKQFQWVMDKRYMTLHLMALVFCMRWDILYARKLTDVVGKWLPLELLCLLLGIGLSFIIRFLLEQKPSKCAKVIICGYFAVLYIALTNTGILWNMHTDLAMLMGFSVVIGLLSVLEKYKVGCFFWNSKNLLRKVLLVLFAFFVVIDLAYVPLEKEKKASIQSVTNTAAETLLAENMGKLKSLKGAKWSKMATEDKLDLLQVVVNIELNHLGINHALDVKLTPLGKNINACYSEKDKTVYVNEKRLEYAESYEMLTAVAHESYHAYQHKMVEVYKTATEDQKKLLVFRKWEKYQNEIQNYVEGERDFKGYYTQTLEADARAYGLQRSRFYYAKIKAQN